MQATILAKKRQRDIERRIKRRGGVGVEGVNRKYTSSPASPPTEIQFVLKNAKTKVAKLKLQR